MWSSFNDKRSMIQMKREVSNPFNKQLDWIFVQKRGKKIWPGRLSPSFTSLTTGHLNTNHERLGSWVALLPYSQIACVPIATMLKTLKYHYLINLCTCAPIYSISTILQQAIHMHFIIKAIHRHKSTKKEQVQWWIALLKPTKMKRLESRKENTHTSFLLSNIVAKETELLNWHLL